MLNVTVNTKEFISIIDKALIQLRLNKDEEFKNFCNWQKEVKNSFFFKVFCRCRKW